MDFINEALLTGQNAHLGGGLLGAVLGYPILLLGGKTLAYILTITLVLVCLIALTGFSVRDFSEKMSDTIINAVETSHEKRQTAREQTLTLDLEEEPEEPPSRPKRLPAVTLAEAEPPKKKKREQPKPKVKDAELQSFSGEFQTKSGGRVKPKAPEPVKTDIFDDLDFEPGDDVPLVVASAKNKPPQKTVVDLPDPTPLFGVQPVKPDPTEKRGGPARQPGVKTAPEGAAKARKASSAEKGKSQPEVIVSNAAYQPPSIDLLDKADHSRDDETDSPEEKARILIETLESFRISAKITHIAVGPALTRFEIQPAPGVRISRITALTNDITMALAAPRLRMEAPIPGKKAIGIEIPNKKSSLVLLRDIIESKEFKNSASSVTMALGREASGKIIVADLVRMPHMLIAGATGSGKSVCINDIIVSMVYKSSPADVKFMLIDPKMVEMSMYSSLPHLLIPVVTEPKKAASAMRWAVNEMTKRYKIFSDMGAKHLDRYNERVENEADRMPRIVIIIDELSDLMMVAPDEVEESIRRIAQLGRAAGIHLILATQRPDATVITGLIKANIPSRAAFAVSSATNSRIILDMGGAEKLLGHGDMLFHPDGSAKPTRLQCAYISDDEVERIVAHFRAQTQHPSFDEQILDDVTKLEKSGPTGGAFGEGKQEDDLLGEAVKVVLEHGQASTSMLQRRLRVGYARASRLIDMMEQKGYVSGFNGSKPRDVLIKKSQYMELFGDETPVADPPEREPNPMAQFYTDEN
jgi:S-DNA-T family DNA segregation ATPase FtsK/SpoIIIE